MSKKRKSKEAKQANKPIRNLHPDASHTGEYADKLSKPEHVQLSDNQQIMDHPARQLPDPQGGNFWGDPNRLNLQDEMQLGGNK